MRHSENQASGRLRVVFLSPSSRLDNGADFCLLDLVKGLSRDEWEIMVVVPVLGPMVEELRAMGIRCEVAEIRWLGGDGQEWKWFGGLPGRVNKLREIFVRERADLVYTNTAMIPEGAIAAASLGVPHIWHVHEGPLAGAAGTLKRVVRSALICLTSDAAVTLTQRAKAYFGLFRPKLFHVVPNGIDTEWFKPGETVRVNHDATSEFVIGVFGAILENKGHRVVLEAVHILRDQGVQIRCVIVGRGEAGITSELLGLVRQRGLVEHVEFAGFSRNVVDAFKRIDLLVSCSYRETFPRVILEAMACAKPVVATRSGGPEEIVIDGETGLLVEPGDVSAVAAAIMTVIRTSDRGVSMGAAGRARAIQFYTVDRYQRDLADIMRSVAMRRSYRKA